ncbi:hypothetical protein SAY87_023169 [Trapa incisa]|uniref:Immediate early response 3-interacting protein 1 n=1 Tax=Trapa incisa TaxID=236973 RepID=A0AAN7Q612_9MYRT|nr:hypothetical protein SAY87_023169 [Trapa incisa]
MGLWTLLEGLLLLANAFAILNEERFLSKRGWSMPEFPGGTKKSLKGQVIGLIYATQYLRVPLILLNGLCIIIKMVSDQLIPVLSICPGVTFYDSFSTAAQTTVENGLEDKKMKVKRTNTVSSSRGAEQSEQIIV